MKTVKATIADREKILLVCLLLLGATLFVYWPVSGFDFLKFDDDKYITANFQLQKGLIWENIVWAFTTTHASNWHPLTWLIHLVNYEIFGLNPGGHHYTNLLLHLASGLILFFALKKMTGALIRSAFVAALFALHPLHVESVAWISELKDVLSAFFWMLTLWAYARYAARPNLGTYAPVFIFLGLGLMAKPMLVTLPLVLLLLDFWPLNRFQGTPATVFSSGKYTAQKRQAPLLPLLLEKLPLILLTSLSCLITAVAQKQGGAVSSLETFSLGTRAANALVSYGAYIAKTIWPSDLAVFYPHPGMPQTWKIIAAATLIALISGLALFMRKRSPYLVTGWLWYLGTLVPVIGLAQVGLQSMADRYTYVPGIGLYLMLAWGAFDLRGKSRAGKRLLTVLGCAALLALVPVSRINLMHWRNNTALFENALEKTADNWMAHNMIGTALVDQGKFAKAEAHYKKALYIRPDYVNAYNNLGVLFERRGKLDQAEAYYKKALEFDPDNDWIHTNLGIVLENQKKFEGAVFHYKKALEINPRSASAHKNLADALGKQGKWGQAVLHYKKALEIHPGFAQARQGLKKALEERGNN